MDDIHLPTVPSGPTTHGKTNGAPIDRLSLMELITEKDRVESELKALGSILDSHGVNMNTSLTTFDGYPRDDIDVAQIRTTRARIIHLKTDYRGLMQRIESALQDHHAQLSSQASDTQYVASQQPASAGNSVIPIDVPFAKVNDVANLSPADAAGLRLGDKIIEFGNVTSSSQDTLNKVAQTVSRNEGKAIPVTLLRSSPDSVSQEKVQITLIPRGWGGRGLLGCHLVPI